MTTFKNSEDAAAVWTYNKRAQLADQYAAAAALKLQKKEEACRRAGAALEAARREWCDASEDGTPAERYEAAKAAYETAANTRARALQAVAVATYELDGHREAVLQYAAAAVSLTLANTTELDGTPLHYKKLADAVRAAVASAGINARVWQDSRWRTEFVISYRGAEETVYLGGCWASVFDAAAVRPYNPREYNPEEVQRLARRASGILKKRAAEAERLRHKWAEEERACSAIPSLRNKLYDARPEF